MKYTKKIFRNKIKLRKKEKFITIDENTKIQWILHSIFLVFTFFVPIFGIEKTKFAKKFVELCSSPLYQLLSKDAPNQDVSYFILCLFFIYAPFLIFIFMYKFILNFHRLKYIQGSVSKSRLVFCAIFYIIIGVSIYFVALNVEYSPTSYHIKWVLFFLKKHILFSSIFTIASSLSVAWAIYAACCCIRAIFVEYHEKTGV